MKDQESLSEDWFRTANRHVLKLKRGRELRVHRDSWCLVHNPKNSNLVITLALAHKSGCIADIKREAEAFARYRGYL